MGIRRWISGTLRPDKLETDSVSTDDATINKSATYPDGTTHSTAPIGAHITTKNPSAVPEVTFDLTGFSDYALAFRSLFAATGGERLILQYSEDGGSTFDSSGYNWQTQIITAGSSAVSGSQSDSGIQIGDDVGGVDGRGLHGSVVINAANSPNTALRASYHTVMRRDGGLRTTNIGGGHSGDSNTHEVDAIRLQFAGDIGGGEVALYGVSN